MLEEITTGAILSVEGARFCVWAPTVEKVQLVILSETEERFRMEKKAFGYWSVTVPGIKAGTRYLYEIDERKRHPDPCSFYQPEGVHEPSEVIDFNTFTISPSPGIAPSQRIFYEIHIGTFTEVGTFDGACERIAHLKELGVNCIQVMPVAAFPGERNWGYDGVYPYAVQESYGGPEGLARFVDTCHKAGMQVYLDVVYNHLGPEGNYLREFGPYFTNAHTTPWGDAVNYDGEYSFGVRKFVVDNALHWFSHYGIDGLRLDAVHGIFDTSAKHILKELSEATRHYNQITGKDAMLIAESDLNDRRIVDSQERNGYGLGMQWLDDFHHAVYTLLTHENQGYCQDFGTLQDLNTAFNQGFVYNWRYSPFRKRFFGSNSSDIDPDKFIAFIQNHDQVGNRFKGERLGSLLDVESLKLAAGLLLLSPYTPLLFMGEEHGESAPFYYFIDHGDPHLTEAVRQGRMREFKGSELQGEFPDPAAKESFEASRPDWSQAKEGDHRILHALYKELIAFRKLHPAYEGIRREYVTSTTDENGLLYLHLTGEQQALFCIFNLSSRSIRLERTFIPQGNWNMALNSATFEGKLPAPKSMGYEEAPAVAARSFLLLTR